MAEKDRDLILKGFRRLVEERMTVQGLSLRQTAARAGMSPSFLSRILTGDRKFPSDEDLLALAGALGIHPPELLLVQAGRIPIRVDGSLTEPDRRKVMHAMRKFYEDHNRTQRRRAG